jgi:hypothetical protein
LRGAEKLFIDALTYDPKMFTAKNNLVLARGAQRRYDLPVVEMTQVERAELAAHDGADRDQAGRCHRGQGPAARSHRHPSAAFRRRRARLARARGGGAGDAKFAAAMAPFFVAADLRWSWRFSQPAFWAPLPPIAAWAACPPFAQPPPIGKAGRRRDFPMGLALSGTLSSIFCSPC